MYYVFTYPVRVSWFYIIPVKVSGFENVDGLFCLDLYFKHFETEKMEVEAQTDLKTHKTPQV